MTHGRTRYQIKKVQPSLSHPRTRSYSLAPGRAAGIRTEYGSPTGFWWDTNYVGTRIRILEISIEPILLAGMEDDLIMTRLCESRIGSPVSMGFRQPNYAVYLLIRIMASLLRESV